MRCAVLALLLLPTLAAASPMIVEVSVGDLGTASFVARPGAEQPFRNVEEHEYVAACGYRPGGATPVAERRRFESGFEGTARLAKVRGSTDTLILEIDIGTADLVDLNGQDGHCGRIYDPELRRHRASLALSVPRYPRKTISFPAEGGESTHAVGSRKVTVTVRPADREWKPRKAP